MLNKDSKKILEKNEFLNERKNVRLLDGFERSKRRLLILSVFVCIAIIAAIYLLTDVSNVKAISVKGNLYLKDEDIVALSELNTDSKYIFVNADTIESRIKTNLMIDECDVVKTDTQTIEISVSEKKAIGYALEGGENVLILSDDSRIILDKNNLYLIQFVPIIEGFSKDELILIEKNLNDVDYKMINEISEIHKYPLLKFQDHELIMRDGNYIFTSVYGLNRVKRYYEMVNSFANESNTCYYIEDISGNAYTSACPWEPKPIEEVVHDPKVETE